MRDTQTPSTKVAMGITHDCPLLSKASSPALGGGINRAIMDITEAINPTIPAIILINLMLFADNVCDVLIFLSPKNLTGYCVRFVGVSYLLILHVQPLKSLLKD